MNGEGKTGARINRSAVLCSRYWPFCTTDSQICASYLIFADGYEAYADRHASDIAGPILQWRKALTPARRIEVDISIPSQTRAALGLMVKGQGRLSNVAKASTRVVKGGTRFVSGKHIAEPNNAIAAATPDDARAGRCHHDFADCGRSRQRRASRPPRPSRIIRRADE
jgi:hypothetical protein